MGTTTPVARVSKGEMVKDWVRQAIATQELSPGQQILSQNQIAERLCVTAVTVHRALSELTDEGVVYRVHGRGTFVAPTHRRMNTLKVALLLPREGLALPETNPVAWHVVQRLLTAFTEVADRFRMFSFMPMSPQLPWTEFAEALADYDAVIFIGASEYGPVIRRLADTRLCLPVVVSASEELTCGGSYILLDTDRVATVRDGIHHLASIGRRQIAFIGSGATTGVNKLEGYRLALEDFGLPYNEDLVVTGMHNNLDGPRGASLLLSRGVPFDALFVDNDQRAAGAIKYLLNQGIRIPEQVAVLGYDGLGLTIDGTRRLSSLQAPYRELISEMLTALADPCVTTGDARRIIRKGSLFVGDTCGGTPAHSADLNASII